MRETVCSGGTTALLVAPSRRQRCTSTTSLPYPRPITGSSGSIHSALLPPESQPRMSCDTHCTRVGAWNSRGRWKQPVVVAMVAVRGD